MHAAKNILQMCEINNNNKLIVRTVTNKQFAYRYCARLLCLFVCLLIILRPSAHVGIMCGRRRVTRPS